MNETTEEIAVFFDNMEQMAEVFGNFDENINAVAAQTGVVVRAAKDGAVIIGTKENARQAEAVIEVLKKMYRKNESVTLESVGRAIDIVRDGHAHDVQQILTDVVAVTAKGRQIKCKSYGQREYVNAIKNNTITIGIGPAGTGKTYLAMALAVVALKNKQISRLILTRPAVEAGENLGFLPGDLQNKVDPYLRPLYDALYDFMGAEAYSRLTEKGAIEVAPLAYMRGRTLNDAFIILDEGQNTSVEQMKMFLTRLGEGSKIVVTGDVTQIDLPPNRQSGLKKAAEILRGINGIEIVRLTQKDVVRHRLVKEIVQAFERYEKIGDLKGEKKKAYSSDRK